MPDSEQERKTEDACQHNFTEWLIQIMAMNK
jgi:hypothetical protein